MALRLVYDFPGFDTGQFEDAEFLMSQGGAQLTVHIAGDEDVVLLFKRVRWHEFTALYNCSPEQIDGAYFKLIEVEDSSRLAKYVASDRASAKAYKELHHFRVFLDEHGCHEIFAESVGTSRQARSGTDA